MVDCRYKFLAISCILLFITILHIIARCRYKEVKISIVIQVFCLSIIILNTCNHLVGKKRCNIQTGYMRIAELILALWESRKCSISMYYLNHCLVFVLQLHNNNNTILAFCIMVQMQQMLIISFTFRLPAFTQSAIGNQC